MARAAAEPSPTKSVVFSSLCEDDEAFVLAISSVVTKVVVSSGLSVVKLSDDVVDVPSASVMDTSLSSVVEDVPGIASGSSVVV